MWKLLFKESAVMREYVRPMDMPTARVNAATGAIRNILTQTWLADPAALLPGSQTLVTVSVTLGSPDVEGNIPYTVEIWQPDAALKPDNNDGQTES
jgi:hypothetical protein